MHCPTSFPLPVFGRRFGTPAFASLLVAVALVAAPAAAAEGQPIAWPSGWATSVAVQGADELIVATADGLLLRESTVCATSVSDPSQVRELYRHPVSVWAVASGEGFVASSDYRGNLAVMKRDSGEMTMHEGVFERWTRALAFAPDGKQIVAGNEAGKLFVWSVEKNAVTKSHELDAVQIYGLDFSPDGKTLAVNDGAGHIHLLSWPELTPGRVIALGEQPLWAAAFAADGQSLIAGGNERKLWKVAVQEGSEPEVIAETSDWITGITVDDKSGAIAACTLDGGVWTMTGAAEKTAEKAGQLPSSGWAIAMPSPAKIVVATRKHAVATLGHAWTIQYAEEPAEAVEEPAEPAEKTAEAPAEAPAEKPADKPAETPAEKPAEKPVEKPADAPAEKPAEKPADAPAEKPAEKPADAPAEKPADAPAEKPAEKPADAPAEKPADAPAEKPADAPAEKPAAEGSE